MITSAVPKMMKDPVPSANSTAATFLLSLEGAINNNLFQRTTNYKAVLYHGESRESGTR
jgi:hypothetical protein